MTRWVWFDETLALGLQLALEVTEEVHRERTGHQDLVIYDTRLYGRVLALDGIIQITERDEFIYSEMMAHVPILAHGSARHVLIIGGGDGAVLEEVLKHRAVERASLVEIDPHVVELSRTYLPAISGNAFDDPRTELIFADGAAFVAASDLRPDIIIVDSTDPVGPGEALFSEAFYAGCRRCLAPGSIMVTQSGVPMTQPQELTDAQSRLTQCFADVSCYAASVPTYAGGLMAFGWAGDDPQKRLIGEAALDERFAEAAIDTSYYTPAVHRCAFALPPYITRLMA